MLRKGLESKKIRWAIYYIDNRVATQATESTGSLRDDDGDVQGLPLNGTNTPLELLPRRWEERRGTPLHVTLIAALSGGEVSHLGALEMPRMHDNSPHQH